MKKYMLLTGATGFIGQYLIRRLLMEDVPLVVIARGNSELTANDRVQAIVRDIGVKEGRELPKPIVFTGDLHAEMLGLDDNALDWFEDNCKSVLHNAASIRFHAPDNDRTKDPWLSNLQGTQSLLDICKFAGIEEFHHVSTAYISGARTDVCLESELDVGQEFINDYQHSKCEAEKLVRAAEFLKSTTIYRPGLVVGDSRDGFTTAPDFGLYHYIQFITQIVNSIREQGATGTVQIPMRLRFAGNETRNLVTIDWVVDVMMHILMNPEYHNETYHLTPSHPTSTKAIMKALADYFDYEGVECIGKEVPLEEQTEIEKMFYDYAETFEAYWEEEPTFDRRNTDRIAADFPTPPVDAACLRLLIDFAVSNCFT